MRNDERNDRMLDSNDLGGRGPGSAERAMDDLNAVNDPTLLGTSHARTDRLDDRLDRDDLADGRTATSGNPGDEIGEAVGGISGVLTGAALGSLGGPIGTIIGGIAGAVSGWWAGKAISEAASHVTDDDESYYRTHYEAHPNRLADRSYDDVRPAYQLGHLAGRNPDYQGREFDDVERDLRHGWNTDVSARHGDWDQVRPYARDAFERGRTSYGTGAVGGSAHTSQSTGATGSSLSSGMSGGSAMGTGSALGAAAGGLGSAAGRVAGSAADRVDDLKDRIDGNPASRPGLDATDRAGYGSGGLRAENVNDRVGGGSLGSAAGGLAGGTSDHTLGGANLAGPSAAGRPLGAQPDVHGGSMASGSTAGSGDTLDRLGDKVENAWDRTKEGARNLADRAGEKLDDTKDRVDGNPASRPGLDRTDSPDRRY